MCPPGKTAGASRSSASRCLHQRNGEADGNYEIEGKADLMEVLNDQDVRFTTAPESLMTYASFMADVGSIKQKPAKWQDMFFPEIHGVTGN